MKKLLTKPIPHNRLLREIYRHYLEYRDYVSGYGKSVIDHGYWIYNEDGTKKDKVQVTISFWDLHDALHTLSARKREAVFYNVLLDWKQKDVAERMGITTVSVGQYVEQAMTQLAERYFAEELGPIAGSSDQSEDVDAAQTLVTGVLHMTGVES